ncbi:MAG: MFS transporter [Flavobacteriaceae bacterium]|nr:MFS transporter [Flavobacteriaceae bacterium]MCY4267468.1 MFS transporter [Flavobacteriaceae bacterium]MCY4299152.1 MFS transporter [Flavobacteriaceae bacterium]
MNKNRLFYASCFALITTAFSFSIRAGIIPELEGAFDLSSEQTGRINQMWFLGFPISMVLGGLLYNTIGPKLIMQFAFFAHTVGIVLTIYAGSYETLLISTLLIGIGNGCTEAACNPVIADAFEGNKMNQLMNRFHMWFPGGILLGGLISFFLGDRLQWPWQSLMWIIMIPTIIYAVLFWGQTFPKPRVSGPQSLLTNFKSMVSFGFILILLCMFFTANTEFGPTYWIEKVLEGSGAKPMIVLSIVAGVMALVRYFGGVLVAIFKQPALMLGCSVLAIIGIYLFSSQSGFMLYVSAVIFAVGVGYYWPNMIGLVAERLPKTGAIGLSIVGGVGMVAAASLQPIIGRWIDTAKAEGEALGLTGTELDIYQGQETLQTMILFPSILVGLFIVLVIWHQRTSQVSYN